MNKRRYLAKASQKFAMHPSRDEVIEDALEGIRRFTNAARLKEWQRSLQWKEKQARSAMLAIPGMPEESDLSNSESTSTETTATGTNATDGLGTNLCPPRLGEIALKKGSPELEALLKGVEKQVVDMAFNYNPNKQEPKLSQAARIILQDLS